jgi:hypothetical protein
MCLILSGVTLTTLYWPAAMNSIGVKIQAINLLESSENLQNLFLNAVQHYLPNNCFQNDAEVCLW